MTCEITESVAMEDAEWTIRVFHQLAKLGVSISIDDFGCDQLQGYLFAKPMSAKALALWAMDDVGPRTMNFRDSLFKAAQPAEL